MLHGTRLLIAFAVCFPATAFSQLQENFIESVPTPSRVPETQTARVLPGDVIFEQIDQCVPFQQAYENSLSFLIGIPLCNADGTCVSGPDDPFVQSGQQNLYFFDSAPQGDGRLIFAIDFKYYTSVAGPHPVRVQVYGGTTHNDPGTVMPGGTYDIALPGSTHIGEADEQTSYFVRMFFPEDTSTECGAVPGFLVGELIDPFLPVDFDLSNVIPEAITETATAWTPVQSLVNPRTYGVAISLNTPGTGWFNASVDYFDSIVTDDNFIHLDKDGVNWESDSGSRLGFLFYGGALCDGPNDGPGGDGGTLAGSIAAGSMYLKLWAQRDANGNDIPDECETAPAGCPNTCADIDGSGGIVNLVDFAAFAVCFGSSPEISTACQCSDLNGDGSINLIDFATFSLAFGGASTNTPPNCP